MNIAALVPTICRPTGLRLALQSLKDTAPHIRPVVAYERDDYAAMLILDEYDAIPAMCVLPKQGCAYAWNTALKAAPDFDAYLIASDDVEFLPGWWEAAKVGLDAGYGFVGLYAAFRKFWYSIFYIMTRDFIVQHHGGVAAVPHYKVWGVDTEACDRAMAAGQYYKTQQQCVVHHHAGLPSEEQRRETKRIYNARRAAGFPDDFERILT